MSTIAPKELREEDITLPENEIYPDTYRYLSWTAVQFVQAPSPLMLLYTALTLTGALSLAIALISIVQMDISIQGVGRLDTDVGTREIVSPSEGILDSFTVHVDDHVKRNDVLAKIRLEGIDENQLIRASSELKTLMIQIDNRQIGAQSEVALPHLPISGIGDTALLTALSALEAAHRNYSQQWKRYYTDLDYELGASKQSIRMLDSKLKIMKGSRQRKNLKLYIETIEDEIERFKSQIAATKGTELQKLLLATTELRRNLELATGALEKYLTSKTVTSPVDGRVAKILVEQGSYVVSSKQLLQLIPEDAKFVVKIQVRSKDIVRIRKGQTVYFRLEAFPHQSFGQFIGKVLTFDRLQDHSKSSADHFIVRASIEPPPGIDIALKSKIRFVVGMNADTYIVTERKNMGRIVWEKLFGKGTP